MTRKITVVVLIVAAAVIVGWRLLGHRPSAQRLATTAPAPSMIPAMTPTPSVTPTVLAAPSPTVRPAPSPAASVMINPSGPRLALIVDDCGQWIDTERGFIALNIPLTLSVLPDVHYTALIAREASDAGKGVMLHLPMETISGLYPGPGEVTTEMTDAQVVAQVEADLAQVPLARGVNNHEGSKASANERVMRDVAGVLAQHGDLFFVDSRTSAASVGAQVARAQGLPTAERDVFLDNRANVAYTEAQLREAAAIAQRTGSAIAIGHPRPTTLAAVRAMIPQLEAAGIHFVLAQDVVSRSFPVTSR